jgi:hypothetical protein
VHFCFVTGGALYENSIYLQPPANTFLRFLSEWTFYRQTHRQIVQISIGQGKITFSSRAKGAKSLRFPGRDTR